MILHYAPPHIFTQRLIPFPFISDLWDVQIFRLGVNVFYTECLMLNEKTSSRWNNCRFRHVPVPQKLIMWQTLLIDNIEKVRYSQGMVMHACYLNTQKAEARR
jgi:hypothetical protein